MTSTDESRPFLAWAEAASLSKVHGESFFILDEAQFRSNFENLLSAFRAHYPDTRIGYSYKTNYTPYLCRIVHELGGYAEVVSEMEYDLAKRLGVPGHRIIFNGPYKSASAFADALLGGATINLDSLYDTSLLTALAASNAPNRFGVVIRCNFSLGTEAISRFGFDVDGADFRTALAVIRETPNLRLKGLHCHFPDRDLKSFGRRARKMATLVRDIFPDAPPESVNIGGGYASAMPESLRQGLGITPATFADYAELVGGILARAFDVYDKPPTLFLEPGTALVADVLRFYTRVISTKQVRGRNFATVAGSLFDISPSARATNLPVTPILAEDRLADGQAFDIAGYTCIENDVLSRQVTAPLKVGDFLCFGNVGSYSVVMKPPFILPANPILVSGTKGFEVIRSRETSEHVFANFRF